jgi:hypothetical protein
MFLDGDVVRDENTYQWISFKPELDVQLTEFDGPKSIGARFRNSVGNESERVIVNIMLDRKPPVITAVTSFDLDDNLDNDGIYHPGQNIVVQAETEPGLEATVRITSKKANYIGSI